MSLRLLITILVYDYDGLVQYHVVDIMHSVNIVRIYHNGMVDYFSETMSYKSHIKSISVVQNVYETIVGSYTYHFKK